MYIECVQYLQVRPSAQRVKANLAYWIQIVDWVEQYSYEYTVLVMDRLRVYKLDIHSERRRLCEIDSRWRGRVGREHQRDIHNRRHLHCELDARLIWRARRERVGLCRLVARVVQRGRRVEQHVGPRASQLRTSCWRRVGRSRRAAERWRDWRRGHRGSLKRRFRPGHCWRLPRKVLGAWLSLCRARRAASRRRAQSCRGHHQTNDFLRLHLVALDFHF